MKRERATRYSRNMRMMAPAEVSPESFPMAAYDLSSHYALQGRRSSRGVDHTGFCRVPRRLYDRRQVIDRTSGSFYPTVGALLPLHALSLARAGPTLVCPSGPFASRDLGRGRHPQRTLLVPPCVVVASISNVFCVAED